MAEPIPLEDIREALEGGTTPSGQPAASLRPQPATRSSRSGIRRIGEGVGVIAITLLTFFALPMIFGGL